MQIWYIWCILSYALYPFLAITTALSIIYKILMLYIAMVTIQEVILEEASYFGPLFFDLLIELYVFMSSYSIILWYEPGPFLVAVLFVTVTINLFLFYHYDVSDSLLWEYVTTALLNLKVFFLRDVAE